ncbi:glycosyltransferase [Ectobacillus ponti]|uniref:Glycosyltransferase family 2 protein n=1 Tax=Ectobacillus ponti TaxID=2961894 RepID=A0AA42BNR0_9BACI|nr:glycosyltransferase family A protein [Ectobacillus ponti]MCP8968260.1 glycosyltransferase family 2 protein [Ectobacillus ponti]
MSLLFWLLLGSSLFLLIWTVCNSLFLPALGRRSLREQPLVTILVPMRNEARNAAALIQTIQQLRYHNFECIILDDQSTDDTWHILQQTSLHDPRFRLIQGGPLPKQWVGKVHACHQLSTHANGEYLLFLDADIRLQPDTIEQALSLLQARQAKLLTGFPAFPVDTLLGRLLVPMQHFVIYTHLPVLLANHTLWKSATAAHGAFMLFERQAYEEIGGHRAVHASLVEDVHMARRMKEQGHRVLLANVTSHVSCYMYETNREAWEGFAKNIFTGLGRSVPLVIGMTCFYVLLYLLPFALLPLSLLYGPLLLLPALLLWLQRLYIDYDTRQQLWLFLSQPLAIIALIAIMNYSMYLALLKKSYYWKGRTYS